ncbi:MAG: terpene cyclase/mutase family protein [Planctomycetes bacterium]|nr:terpene cyclase/mutase family protein [Planctomycetota bacterium]
MQIAANHAALRATALGVLALLGAPSAHAQAPEWKVLPFQSGTSQGGATFTPQADGSVLVGGESPERDVHRLSFELELGSATGVRIEALAHPSLAHGGPGRSPGGNFVLNEARLLFDAGVGGEARELPIATATAGFDQAGHAAQSSFDGLPNTGWAVHPHLGKSHELVVELLRDAPGKKGAKLVLELSYQWGERHAIGCYRVSATSSPRPIRATDGQHEEPWSAMQEKINRAIDRGVEYLLGQQELDGSWRYHAPEFVNGQTALATYTLLKSGLKREHQAVQRGLAYLKNSPCVKTYEIACTIMAFVATKDPQHAPFVQQLSDELSSWQHKDGGYAYPEGRVDLSNTQYAALGLRAAASSGATVEPETWRLLIQRTLKHQAVPSGAYDPAGFGYVDTNDPTGSMTCAGISILKIAHGALQGVAEKDRRDGDLRGGAIAGVRRGVDWLGRNFSVTTNPPDNKHWNWYRYYLYGLERVGALIGEREIGGHDWYREGARQLVRTQRGDGSWDDGDSGQPETCYALLFLVKATSPATGASAALGVRNYGGDDPKSALSLRASGDTPITLWISSFGDATKKAYAWPEDPAGELRVARVEYVEPDADMLVDAQGFPVPWRHTARTPVPAHLAGPWLEAGYDDDKWDTGPVRYAPDPATKERELFLRRRFELGKEGALEPRLLLLAEESAGASAQDLPPAFALVDEGALLDLPTKRDRTRQELSGGGSGGSATAVRVAGSVIENPAIPGWSYPIRKNPGKGEFRFVRFAWRKSGGKGIMLQLATDGRWETAMRYYAGENSIGFEPALQVDKKLPSDWVVVTRDLFRDLGRECVLTGLSYTAMDGEAGFYDQIYLGRSANDLQKLPAPSAAKEEPVAELEIWLNGASVHRGPARTSGYAEIANRDALLAALRPGTNVLCMRAPRAQRTQVLDLRLTHEKRLATMSGDPLRPAGSQRFAFQQRYPDPGDRSIAARVTLAVPPTEEGRTHDEELIESKPLRVEIREALDPALLDYATDPGRNLLPSMAPAVSASSQLNEYWAAGWATDNRQSRAWLSADSDLSPWISIATAQPLRCNAILLSHPKPDRDERERARTARARIVELEINGKGPAILVEMPPTDLRKLVVVLPKVVSLRQLRARVLEVRDVRDGRRAVGFGEIEVQLRKTKE